MKQYAKSSSTMHKFLPHIPHIVTIMGCFDNAISHVHAEQADKMK